MSFWVVVGGQYGSEGKGKIAAYLTERENIDICLRCGGPNSGHCFVDESGELRVMRQLPTGFIKPSTRLLIPAGGLIDLEVLENEIRYLGVGPDRVGVDINAMTIEESDKRTEQELGLRERLSSTLCGVGSAVARRVLRGSDVALARQATQSHPWLKPYLTDVSAEVNVAADEGKNVLVEGTQGFGLSLYHSGTYPKTTSRDTSAAGCLSECGISPRLVTEVVLVIRTFPIRVAGQQAGPMSDEITWATIREESGAPCDLSEFTTVTGKLRRVGRFDWDLAQRAVSVNRPTKLAINFLDYLDFENRNAASRDALNPKASEFVEQVEARLKTPVTFFGVGPSLGDTFGTKPCVQPSGKELYESRRTA